MAGIQGLQQIESFAAAHLAHNDSVWPVTKGSHQQIADRTY